MKVNYTLHTHTIGFDGKNTVAEMVDAARAGGFRTIGFSNHFIVHPEIKKSRMYEYAVRGGYANIYNDNVEEAIAKFAPHYDTVRTLREKHPDMNILCGMETDWFQYPEWTDAVNYAVRRLNPDYIIGAMHFLDLGADGVLNVHDIKNADPRVARQLLREYYQNLMKMAEIDWRNMGFRFNWVAHFDLPRKVGQYDDDMEDAALRALAQNNMPVEINTALMGNRNYGPIGTRAKKIKDITTAGIPVLVTDDAHDISRIGTSFDIVAKLAEARNFYTNFNKLKQKINIRSH